MFFLTMYLLNYDWEIGRKINRKLSTWQKRHYFFDWNDESHLDRLFAKCRTYLKRHFSKEFYFIIQFVWIAFMSDKP